LEIVRCLARHLAAVEPGTEIPPRRLLGVSHRRTSPHIFSEAEILQLMTAARRLGPPDGIRPRTYAALLGLLASAGLRISEALRLFRADFNATDGVVTIRETKFGKSRIVPTHATATMALVLYARDRDRLIPHPRTDHFFLSSSGEGLPYSTVRSVFRNLCDGLRITGAGRRRPRLHDIRHTFACRRVETWYDAGADLAHAVSALSVYLGHAKVTDTYWYLTATPSLMARAAGRFESFARPTEGEVRP
jgi:integrase